MTGPGALASPSGHRPLFGALVSVAIFVLLLGVPLAHGQPVPHQVPFQGLLLDATGAPLTDAVDLDFTLFDAITAGNALWTESQSGISVVDGVYAVDLGSTTPLTPAVVGGGALFLEVTVDGEVLVPRQQLLSVPYALTAERAQHVGGVDAVVFEQLYTHFPFDGEDPPNGDPREGTVDVDGDGIANFLDADNDGDGISDADELAAGSDLNLETPQVSVAPLAVRTYFDTTLNVTGTLFDQIASVSFAGLPGTPVNLTATSFQLPVVTETSGTSADFIVTLTNGQSAVQSLTLNTVPPLIFGAPTTLAANQVHVITITGNGFWPGTVVEIAGQTLIPSALSPFSMTVTLPPTSPVTSLIRVIHPNGLTASRTVVIEGQNQESRVFLSSAIVSGDFGGIAAADAICQSEADAAGLLGGPYQAWLSDSTTSPATRFNTGRGPYQLVNDATVAVDWLGLTGGLLLTPINRLADGTQITGTGVNVWTATDSAGNGQTNHCTDWSGSGSAQIGDANSTTNWSGPAVSLCSGAARFYCFGN